MHQLLTKQVNVLSDGGELDDIAQSIRDEFPISKFNELLQDFLAALMEESEGNVQEVTDCAKDWFEHIKKSLSHMSPREAG